MTPARTREPFVGTRPTLSPADLFGGARRRLPEPLDGHQVTFHVKARNALWHVVRALALEPQETVLVSSYNCGAELDGVLKAPAAVRFYRVDRSARVDVDDLRRAVDRRTRAVLVTHFFGFPDPHLPAIVELCQDRGLFLIEDCAHALYSTRDGRPLGTLGDAAVFSLWKTLPVPDGGAALLRGGADRRGPLVSPPLAPTLRALRYGVEAHLLFRFGRAGATVNAVADAGVRVAGAAARSVRRRSRPAPPAAEPGLNPHVTFNPATAAWSMSDPSRRILARSRHREIVQRRRRNYAFLARELAAVRGTRLLRPELPDGVCPVALPLVVEEPESLLHALAGASIGAELFWSDFHPAFPAREFPDSAYLKTHVVALPIHQDLDPRLLARVARVVEQWARER